MSMRAVRIAMVVLAIALALAIARAFSQLDDTGIQQVESDEVAFSVLDAVQEVDDTPIPVRGYVYDDGAFLMLCNGLRDGDPPLCQGPSVLLEGLDISRLDLKEDTDEDRTIFYTEDPVVLAGVVFGTEMRVTEILN